MTRQAWTYLLVAACVFAAAYQTQTGWLYAFASLAAALVAVAALGAWGSLRGVAAEAEGPGGVYEDEVLRLRVRLRGAGNRLGRRWLGVAAPGREPAWHHRWLRGELVPEGWAQVAFPRLAAGGEAEGELMVAPGPRGEHPLPPLLLQSAFPLGLVVWARRLETRGSYCVFPRGPHLRRLPWLDRAAGSGDRRAAAVESRSGLVARSVREYLPGDGLREIHWRSSARLGLLRTRESERERGEALRLFLDLAAEAHTEATLEHMIRVAAGISEWFAQARRPLHLMAQPEAMPAGGGPDPLDRLYWLARAQARPASPPLPPATLGASWILLSPRPLPGWREWADWLILTPEAGGAMGSDATLVCPLGADLQALLESGGEGLGLGGVGESDGAAGELRGAVASGDEHGER